VLVHVAFRRSGKTRDFITAPEGYNHQAMIFSRPQSLMDYFSPVSR